MLLYFNIQGRITCLQLKTLMFHLRQRLKVRLCTPTRRYMSVSRAQQTNRVQHNTFCDRKPFWTANQELMAQSLIKLQETSNVGATRAIHRFFMVEMGRISTLGKPEGRGIRVGGNDSDLTQRLAKDPGINPMNAVTGFTGRCTYWTDCLRCSWIKNRYGPSGK